MIEGEKYDNSYQKLCRVQYKVWNETAILSKLYNQSLSALIEWQLAKQCFTWFQLLKINSTQTNQWIEMTIMHVYVYQSINAWMILLKCHDNEK